MKYIDAEKLKAEIEERIALLKGINSKGDYAKGSIDADMGILNYIDSLQQEQSEVDLEKEVKQYWNAHALEYRLGRVADIDFLFLAARHFYELGRAGKRASIECMVRVYPELDEEPRPWVSLCGKGISMISFRDLPELESLGFKDYDTAIVTIARKEE